MVWMVWLVATVTAFSQEGNKELVGLEERKFLNNLGVSIKASPFLGYVVEVSTAIRKQLTLRAGLNLTKGISVGQYNIELDYDEDLEDSFGYIPNFRAKPTPNFSHGNVLLDYHPGGVFHITAGLFVGATKVEANGYLADEYNKKAVLLPGKNWPSVEIDDNTRMDFKDGKAELGIRIGRAVKPYFGLGFGRAVPKKRMSFKFEMGMLYQGNKYVAKQNNKVYDLSTSTQAEFRDMDKMLNYPIFGFWPQMNFQLSYRIF